MPPGSPRTSPRRLTPADVREVATIGCRVVVSRFRPGSVTGGVTSIVLDPDGRLLLVSTSYQRGWSTPGGYLDPGEDPASGIRRELTEEVGLPADGPPLRPLMQLVLPRHVNTAFGLELSAAHALELTPVSWEITRLGWFGPDELPRLREQTRLLLGAANAAVEVDRGRWVLPPRR